MSPFSVPDKTINKIASRNMLESSWIGGFPFSSSGFNDEVNYYFAKDTNGGAIILDLWKRGGDRTNSNVVIMGTAGVGKSTVAKHLILKEYMMGTRQIIIDPEREYKDMTYNLEGKWIDVGSGRGGMINPLQIKQVPLDDDTNTYLENSDDSKGMGAMALHFQTLHTFFKLLYPELTSSEEAVLDEMLEKLYNKFNISWNTDITNIPNDKFPILEDLYNLIIENIDNEKEDIKKQKLVLIKNLIRGICIGAESSLFNGKTTVETDSAVVCFDTFNLQNASERVKKAQYFNILTYCWELMSKDKEEKTMLVCDEAYLLIDPQVPQTLVFLRNVSKRCRKYEGSLVIISHSVVDFIDDSVRMYGQAILDMATYKILMGTDGKNLEDTKEIFKLTEAQADFLYKKKRNMGVFIIGSNRVFANFLVKDKELKIFGKGGGR
jgi:type IV secretory pathway VirB4 component